MKNAILITLFSLLTSLSIGQQKIEAYAVQMGKWSEVFEDWQWAKWEYSDITFILRGNVVIVNDAAKSSYTTIGDAVWQSGYASWTAIDEKGRKCLFSMSYNKNPNYIIVVYDDVCFKYAY